MGEEAIEELTARLQDCKTARLQDRMTRTFRPFRPSDFRLQTLRLSDFRPSDQT